MSFASPAVGSATAEVVRHVLPNGVRVVVMRDRAAPMVAARAVWSGGRRREPDELGGVSRVLALAWTGGCGERDAAELAGELVADGASMLGFAGRDTMGLQAEWTRSGWEQGFELLADCVAGPRFAPDAIGRGRERAADLAAQRGRHPTWAALDLLDRRMLGVEPVGSLERIDSAGLLDHYRVHYPVSAMTLAFVGDVDPERVLDRVRARFGGSPRQRRPAASPAARKDSDRELYRHLPGDSGVAAVALGFEAVGRAHSDRAALEVAAAVLGARAELVADAEAGYLAAHRVCPVEHLPAELDGLRRAIARLHDPGPSEAEVRRAASRLAEARGLALARAPRAAALLALYEVLGPGAEHATRHADRLRAVRAADVRAAAERYLTPESAVVATAMPMVASPEVIRRARGVVRPGKKAPRPRARKRARRRR